MGDWLASRFTVGGVTLQNWMLIALAIILVAIMIGWLRTRWDD